MRFAILSDLHIGPLDSTDDCLFSTDDLIKMFRFMTNNYDKLILNGDILELTKKGLCSTHRDKYREIQRQRNKFINYINEFLYKTSDKIIFIRGNHDFKWSKITSNAYVFTDSYILPGNTYVSHGHMFDPSCKKYNWFTKCYMCTDYNIEQYISADIDKTIHYQTLINLFSSDKKIIKNALDFKISNNFDNIIIGHTHQSYADEKIGYYNSGTFNNREYIEYDYDEQTRMTKINLKIYN